MAIDEPAASCIGLIGGVGDRAAGIVGAQARRDGLTLDGEDELAIAFPPATVAAGRHGAQRVWLAGRVYADERPAPGGDGLATATAVAERLGAGAGAAATLFGAYLLVSRDRDRRAVSVFHDHMGARTIHYARLGNDTLFAEHLADLLRLLPATPSPRRLAVAQWINTRTLPLGGTFYEDVARLGIGRSVELTRAGAREQTIWRPRFEESLRLDPAELGDYVVDQAFTAIDRAAADLHRAGVRLSGGLDSACVAAGLARHGGATLAVARTFPGFPFADEEDLIRATAAHAGLELVALPYTDTPVLEPMRRYVCRWAIPSGSPNIAMWPPIVALARQHGVDGLLDGEGGDEVFGAWPMLIAQRALQLRLGEAWRLTSALPYIGALPGRRYRLRLLWRFGIEPLVPWLVRRAGRAQRPGVTAGPFVASGDAAAVLAAERAQIVGRHEGPMWWRGIVNGFIGRSELVDSGGHLWRSGHDEGTERRHPFLHDARLLTAMLRVPPAAQYRGPRDRPTLRDGLAGRIPEAVNQRYAKGHYNDVTVQALAGPDGRTLLDQLASPDAPIRDYVREGSLDILREYATSAGLERYQLTNVLMHLGATDIWLRSLSAERA